MDQPESAPPEVEHRHHAYRGNVIPWFVRALWIGFWIFAVYYTVVYLFPSLRVELLNAP